MKCTNIINSHICLENGTLSIVEVDYYFQVGYRGNFQSLKQFGFTSSGCGVNKTWYIDGNCYNMRVRVR